MLLYLLAGVSIAGTILNIKKRRSGFILWLVTNLIWMVIDLRADLPAQALLFAVYAGCASWGWIAWGRKS